MTYKAMTANRWNLAERVGLTSGLMLSVAIIASLATASSASGWQRQALLASGLIVLSAIAVLDIRTLRAPNRIVYPATLALTVGFATLGAEPALSAAAGGAMSFSVLLLCVGLGRGSMGYGDAKVGFICGMLVGPSGLLPMLLATFFVGGCFAAIALTTGLKARRDVVAFTPFLLVGVMLTLWTATAEGMAWFE